MTTGIDADSAHATAEPDAATEPEATTEPAATTEADARLRAIIDAEWSVRIATLGSADDEGDESGADQRYQLPAVDPAVLAEAAKYWDRVIDDLDQLDVSALSPAAVIDLQVFRFQIETQRDRLRFRGEQWAANSDTAFWTMLTGRTPDVFSSVADAEAFTGMLQQIPDFVEHSIDNLRAGLQRGFGPARISMQGRDATAAAVAEATAAAGTPFFAPYLRLLTSADGTTPDIREKAETVVTQAVRVIEDAVIPSFRTLRTFLAQEYLPQLPESPAVVDRPDGAEFYAAQLREYTTTDLTPHQIHQLGLTEVADIHTQMQQIAAELDYAGEDPVGELLTFMRTDPQFFATSAEQLLQFGAWECKKFDAIAHHWFGRLPRRRFGVVEPDPALAPTYTAGRGGPGKYVLNTYNLPARPLHSIPALTLHEAAPGHAFQIPFAQELDLLPFRRLVYISAYGEGWALYCERLGVEMGIYENSYQLMGMLSFQMWRAVRLVIDPGIHALGWSRERAIDYLLQHTAMSEHDVRTEVDRYISWPGQAAAYYLGMLEIRRLRRLAEQSLGDSFDVRAFHDCVLSTGSVPLSVLVTRIDTFIADGGASPFD